MSTKMGAILLVTTLLLALALAVIGLRPAQAQPPQGAAESITRTISVNGLGRVSAVPDQATIQLGVRTEGTTAEAALNENNERMAALLAALRGTNIATRDIQTRDFSIWPQYRTSGEEQVVRGYEVSNMVYITVRDLDNFGTILDAAVRAGGNQVQGIQFGFSNPDALLDEAREAAMADAAHKAGLLAEQADVTLGPVVTISESGGGFPTPLYMRGAEMAAADVAVPIESGESEVTANVQVTYELVP